MNLPDDYLYSILRSGARALAGYAAAALPQRDPRFAEGFGDDPFAVWQALLADRVQELAAAVATGRPAMFAAQCAWVADLLSARGIPAERLIAALHCLRGVMERELPEASSPPALAVLDSGLDALGSPRPASPSPAAPESPAERLVAEYLVAVLGGDRRRAGDLVLGAARDGFPVAELYTEVLLKAQEAIGRMWLAADLSVAEEHFVSATTRRLVSQLAALAPSSPPNGKTVVTAAVAGNQHEIGLEVVAELFDFDGWRTIHLGADVPAADVAQAVEFFQADLLSLSAALTTQVPAVRATIGAVRGTGRGRAVKILVGGQGFAGTGDLPREIGADGYAAEAAEAVRAGRRLVGLA